MLGERENSFEQSRSFPGRLKSEKGLATIFIPEILKLNLFAVQSQSLDGIEMFENKEAEQVMTWVITKQVSHFCGTHHQLCLILTEAERMSHQTLSPIVESCWMAIFHQSILVELNALHRTQ